MIYENQNISSSIQGYLLLVLTGIKNAPTIKKKNLTSYWICLSLSLLLHHFFTSPLHFGSSFYFSSFRRQGHYSPKQSYPMRNTCP